MGICGTTSAAFLLPVLGSKQNLYWTLGLFFHKDHEETLSLFPLRPKSIHIIYHSSLANLEIGY
jgi:hypothetical protein